MSNNLNKESLRRQAKNAIKRIEDLEQQYLELAQAMQSAVTGLQKRTSVTEEIIDAVVEMFGVEKVQEAIDQRRKERDDKAIADQKKDLEDGVEVGYLSKSDAVTATSLIVGKETDSQGNVMGLGFNTVLFEQIGATFQDQLLGKGVGTSIDTPVNGKFEVLEVYNLDKDKYQEFVKAKAVPVTEAEQVPQSLAPPQAPEVEAPTESVSQ